MNDMIISAQSAAKQYSSLSEFQEKDGVNANILALHGIDVEFDDTLSVIFANGDEEWHRNGILHRDDDEPAMIRANGDKFWYQNGLYHRDDGKPAIEFANGKVEYWVNGKQL